ncbi:uncharacterized protein BXZ73DRAFT_55471 [Epithele typhae]|uniref:uncharacterized protein n=1 Tax=Epithele typhae TaxID=378194 RepID=UPI0020089CD2|nr:uncharacterized protein BXZ73DRAFT_55471 [Epithele typhae]KAH9913567.1 hypothetical protein BXZ73DRAFT_55471 [Epithele typhae]
MRYLLSVFAVLSWAVLRTRAHAPAWANLAIQANGRLLERTVSGEPFLWQADTVWEIFQRLNKSDVDFYLQNRAAKGYNVIQAVAIAEIDGTTRPNFYGDLPLQDQDPLLPNDAYYKYVDYVVERAAHFGILVALVPTWGRYVNGGWHQAPIIFNESNAYEYGRFIGARYPGLPKIIGADSNAFWSINVPVAQQEFRDDPTQDPDSLIGPVIDTRAVWASMRNGLEDGEHEKGFELFSTYHPTNPRVRWTPEAYGSNYINGSYGTLSMNGVQSGHSSQDPNTLDFEMTALPGWDATKNYENIAAMRAIFDGPVIDLENHYEGANDNFNTSRPAWNASQVRHGLYYGVFSGACGFTYGANAVWQLYDPLALLARPDLYIDPILNVPADFSWREAMDMPAAGQAQHLTRLLARLPADVFRALEPDRSFVSGANGALDWESDRRTAALASGGTHFFVYAGHGDSFALDLGNVAGRAGKRFARAAWYSPRDGSFSEGGIVELGGERTFEPPSSGSVDDDWVLELVAL